MSSIKRVQDLLTQLVPNEPIFKVFRDGDSIKFELAPEASANSNLIVSSADPKDQHLVEMINDNVDQRYSGGMFRFDKSNIEANVADRIITFLWGVTGSFQPQKNPKKTELWKFFKVMSNEYPDNQKDFIEKYNIISIYSYIQDHYREIEGDKESVHRKNAIALLERVKQTYESNNPSYKEKKNY